MNLDNLTMEISYSIYGTYSIGGNFKEEVHAEVISEYLRTQLGRGADDSKMIERRKYLISISLDTRDDTFHVSCDTNNRDLRDGILRDILSKLKKKSESSK